MKRFDIKMTPISVLWKELLEVNKSFIILWDTKTRETCVMEGDITVSSAENIDMAIIRAWKKIFGKEMQ